MLAVGVIELRMKASRSLAEAGLPNRKWVSDIRKIVASRLSNVGKHKVTKGQKSVCGVFRSDSSGSGKGDPSRCQQSFQCNSRGGGVGTTTLRIMLTSQMYASIRKAAYYSGGSGSGVADRGTFKNPKRKKELSIYRIKKPSNPNRVKKGNP